MIILAIIGAISLTGLLFFLYVILSDNYSEWQNARHNAYTNERASFSAFKWSLFWFSVCAGIWWWLIGSRFIEIGWK